MAHAHVNLTYIYITLVCALYDIGLATWHPFLTPRQGKQAIIRLYRDYIFLKWILRIWITIKITIIVPKNKIVHYVAITYVISIQLPYPTNNNIATKTTFNFTSNVYNIGVFT